MVRREDVEGKDLRRVQPTRGFVEGPLHRKRLAPISMAWSLPVLAAVAYGSLIPFSFDLSSLSPANLFGLLNIHLFSTGPEDFFTNFFVYMPVGAALILSPLLRRRPWVARWVVVVLIGLGLSSVIEALQTTIAIRVGSWTDVAINTLGTAVGAAVAGSVYSFAAAGLLRLRSLLSIKPMTGLAVVLSLGLLTYHLAPFDFVLNPVGLLAALGRAQWSPLGAYTSATDAQALTAVASDLAVGGWFAMLGYFWVLANRESGRQNGEALLAGAGRGIKLVFMIEALQLLTQSHTFELSDVAMRAVMVLLGASIAPAMTGHISPARWRRRPCLALPTSLLILFLIVQLFAYMAASFATAEWSATASLSGPVRWLPFEALWRGSMAGAAAEIISTIMRFAVLAITIGLCLRRFRIAHVWLIAGALVTALAAHLEVLRLFDTAHAPDPTMPLLALLAAVAVAQTAPFLRPRVASVST